LTSIDQPFDRIHQFVDAEWFPEIFNPCLRKEAFCLGAHYVSGDEQEAMTQIGI